MKTAEAGSEEAQKGCIDGNEGYMLPKPDVGQKVRLEGREGQFIVKSVSMDGGLVDVVAERDRNIEIVNVPCVDLLLAEGESPD